MWAEPGRMSRGDTGKGARGGVRAQRGVGLGLNTWQEAGLEAVSCKVPLWILGHGVSITKAPPWKECFRHKRDGERERSILY